MDTEPVCSYVDKGRISTTARTMMALHVTWKKLRRFVFICKNTIVSYMTLQ